MRFFIPILLLGMLFNVQTAAGAQYAHLSAPFQTFNYIDTTSGGTGITLGDNAVSAPVDLGFTFNYYGKDYTQILIGSNGTIGFPVDTTGLDTTTILPALPDAAAPNAVIAPFSADLDPSAGGSVHYLAGGTAGSRYLAVEWNDVPVKGKGGVRSFEAVLYEDNGDILFSYKTLRGGEAIDAATVTLGIENLDGSAGLPVDVTQIAEGESVLFSENPADADGNGLIDRFESFYNLTGGGAGDDDGDGLSNADEFTAGTRPDQTDTDGDGISDKNDADPLATDSDSDGLRDAVEDVNKDGVTDVNETDSGSIDTDGDGYTDGAEITYGRDPLDAASTPSLNVTVVTGSIQATIDAAAPGDRIYIPARTAPYIEDLTINRAVTLIGAGADFTTIQGTITVSGVSGATLNGFTIEKAATAVKILGDATAATDINCTKVTLKNCTDGILISDAAASGGTTGAETKVVLDGVRFTVTDPMTVGYGIKIEELQDTTDDVLIDNSSVTLTGSGGGIIVDTSRNIEIRGTSVSRAETTGIMIAGDAATAVTSDNDTLSNNYGTGITVAGNGSGITLNRDTLSGNHESGILFTGNALATLTDNTIAQNGGYGMEATGAPTVTNSGNALTGNISGPYSDTAIFSADTPADIAGASSTEQVIAQSTAWIPAASGGAVALIEPPAVLSDPIASLFGTSISFPAGALSEDTRVTIEKSTASYPSLPITFNYPMPVVAFSLEQGTLTGTATITLPVLAGYDTDAARVFHLVGNSWKEITAAPPAGRSVTTLDTTTIAAVHQQVSFQTNGLGTFILVIDLPLLDHGDPGGGGGCTLREKPETGASSPLPDTGLLLSPLLFLLIKYRKRWSAIGK